MALRTASKASIVLMSMMSLAAAPTQGADPAAPMQLNVKPLLCVTDRFTGSCDLALHIQWQSLRFGNYCLNADLQTASVNCWIQADRGEWRERRAITRDFRYWMSAPSGESLAAVKIEFLQLDSADRRRQRRTRHVWDVL